MDKKDILKNVYDDFFGIDKITKNNEILNNEINNLTNEIENFNKDYPTINIKHNTHETETLSKEDKDNKMKESTSTSQMALSK